ncbi:MAG: hypothetical protein WCA28_31055 [Bradyrhizobium sp.]
MKQLPRAVGLVETPERGVSDALGVMVHRRRNQIKRGVVRQRRIDDFLPAPETHHHVHAHRIVAFEARGEFGPALRAENLFRQHAAQFVRRGDRIAVSAHEHAGVHHQKQIVRTGRRVRWKGAGISEIFFVSCDRPFAGDLRLPLLPAQDIDMSRHMVHVACVRTHCGECDRRGFRAFRLIRHLENMDMQMEQRRMSAPALSFGAHVASEASNCAAAADQSGLFPPPRY